MRTQARFRTSRRNTTKRPQHARRAEQNDPRRPRKRRRQAVQHHGRIVEDIGREPVHFAFGLERRAEPVREQDRRHPAK